VSIVDRFQQLDDAALISTLTNCCASRQWIRQIAAERPFSGDEQLLAKATEVWNRLSREDWLEAFAAHPKIGDREALRSKFSVVAAWAGQEQAGIRGAADDVLQRLLLLNREYEEKFGYIFIVCASGKTAEEMLAILESRLANDEPTELRLAAAEQLKITLLRLRKLSPMTANGLITTHVLDTSTGRPASGMEFELARQTAAAERWMVIAQGTTNADGRSSGLPSDGPIIAGIYRLRFATGAYFERQGIATFYPHVTVEFRIDVATEKHHVPLLISPFGYSTYRGS
jgi:5-hydroxyisourate hydrolase / 2-oxo-4-hydroxy-4-carboxy-5-ureidoimidazoline decarboxylase